MAMTKTAHGPQIPLDDDHRPRPLWRRVLAALSGVRLGAANRGPR